MLYVWKYILRVYILSICLIYSLSTFCPLLDIFAKFGFHASPRLQNQVQRPVPLINLNDLSEISTIIYLLSFYERRSIFNRDCSPDYIYKIKRTIILTDGTSSMLANWKRLVSLISLVFSITSIGKSNAVHSIRILTGFTRMRSVYIFQSRVARRRVYRETSLLHASLEPNTHRR